MPLISESEVLRKENGTEFKNELSQDRESQPS